MSTPSLSRRSPRLRVLSAAPLLAALGACNTVVLNPAGDVARQQAHLVIASTALMLLIIVPVMALTVLFAWRYRASNQGEATYEPDWDHSTQLELIIWSAPLLIIICLGALTWISAHLLDPYRPVNRIAPGRAVAANVKPLVVDVVALDWKWLFIYPQYGIATVNEMAAPVDRPVLFNITSSSVMNSFYIPALAGQIYAMPGMETRLNAVINKPGDYKGFSANYSGAGFSGMHFVFHGLPQAGFDRWVQQVRSSPLGRLDGARYRTLSSPSENVPALRFAGVAPDLYRRVLNECTAAGTICLSQTMRQDMARGGERPVDDTATPQNGQPTKGAIFKSPEEKGTGPNITKPRRRAPGVNKPGSDANRDMTANDIHPGVRAPAHA